MKIQEILEEKINSLKIDIIDNIKNLIIVKSDISKLDKYNLKTLSVEKLLSILKDIEDGKSNI
jgi:hypothetical protein